MNLICVGKLRILLLQLWIWVFVDCCCRRCNFSIRWWRNWVRCWIAWLEADWRWLNLWIILLLHLDRLKFTDWLKNFPVYCDWNNTRHLISAILKKKCCFFSTIHLRLSIRTIHISRLRQVFKCLFSLKVWLHTTFSCSSVCEHRSGYRVWIIDQVVTFVDVELHSLWGVSALNSFSQFTTTISLAQCKIKLYQYFDDFPTGRSWFRLIDGLFTSHIALIFLRDLAGVFCASVLVRRSMTSLNLDRSLLMREILLRNMCREEMFIISETEIRDMCSWNVFFVWKWKQDTRYHVSKCGEFKRLEKSKQFLFSYSQSSDIEAQLFHYWIFYVLNFC